MWKKNKKTKPQPIPKPKSNQTTTRKNPVRSREGQMLAFHLCSLFTQFKILSQGMMPPIVDWFSHLGYLIRIALPGTPGLLSPCFNLNGFCSNFFEKHWPKQSLKASPLNWRKPKCLTLHGRGIIIFLSFFSCWVRREKF